MRFRPKYKCGDIVDTITTGIDTVRVVIKAIRVTSDAMCYEIEQEGKPGVRTVVSAEELEDSDIWAKPKPINVPDMVETKIQGTAIRG